MTLVWFAWILSAFVAFALFCDRVAQAIMTSLAARRLRRLERIAVMRGQKEER